jgi:hypothetical protein
MPHARCSFSRSHGVLNNPQDLKALLHKRITDNDKFLGLLGVSPAEPEAVFDSLFPSQVDSGKRKPTTWTWIMGRIRDGNDVKPPRNLIDLVLKSREAQLRREERAPRKYINGQALLEADSIKRGLDALSNQRVEDTLLAEAGDLSGDIELFRRGKAEYNGATLRELLGDSYIEKVRMLQQFGFLETVGTNYKIPMLYRSGLGITQGKAW